MNFRVLVNILLVSAICCYCYAAEEGEPTFNRNSRNGNIVHYGAIRERSLSGGSGSSGEGSSSRRSEDDSDRSIKRFSGINGFARTRLSDD